MPPEKISRTFAENLLRLSAGDVLNSSAFGNRRQLGKLVEDRVVVRMVAGRNRARIHCPNPAALRNYLRLHFGITDLEQYTELLSQENRDGEDSLRATASTKTLRKKSIQGFFIKAFSTPVEMDGNPLDDLPAGVDYFVSDAGRLKISSTALVVGVENPECFMKADRLLHLFPQKELVFVLKYHSHSPVQWLETVANPYLHFGDFDPAGIAIYCNEYLRRLGAERCRFFVPDGIEMRIEKQGDPGLYNQQAHLWPPSIKIVQPDLQRVVHCISQFGKGLEQEQLLLDS
jgi:hypothetical protein